MLDIKRIREDFENVKKQLSPEDRAIMALTESWNWIKREGKLWQK